MTRTLHVAVCNTNFADRKQIERLLNKVSDTVKEECLIYTETFGSAAALLYTKRIYDIYILEVNEGNYTSRTLAEELRKREIKSPVIFVSPEENSTVSRSEKDLYYFITHCIHQDELAAILKDIAVLKEQRYVPKIEFRNNKETFYLEADTIIYIEHQGLTMFIHLKDGNKIMARGEIQNAFSSFSPYPSFFMPSKNYIINANYIKKVSSFKLTLSDNTTIPVSVLVAQKVKLLLTQLK